MYIHPSIVSVYNVCIYIYVYVYIHVCVYIYIYIYICIPWRRGGQAAASPPGVGGRPEGGPGKCRSIHDHMNNISIILNKCKLDTGPGKYRYINKNTHRLTIYTNIH